MLFKEAIELTKEDQRKFLEYIKSRLHGKVNEWLGFDIPAEGSEDYSRWQCMLLDIDDIRDLQDAKSYIEESEESLDDYFADFMGEEGIITALANTSKSTHLPTTSIANNGHAIAAEIIVEWGYELHSITLIPRNWRKVKSGKPLSIRGKGYYYDGEFFWDYWTFSGGISGELIVTYGDDGGTGFEGNLFDAEIREFQYASKRGDVRKNPHVSAVNEKAMVKPDQGISPTRHLRSVLIVITKWPGGTMAFKFGYAMQSALQVTKEKLVLVQMEPERIFRVETSVCEYEFREALKKKGVSCGGNILFIEL